MNSAIATRISPELHLETLHGIISDMYKDANGMRPRSIQYWERLDTEEKCLAEMDSLEVAVIAVIDQERLNEKAAIVKFEQLIAATIEMGAWDRETAIRWLLDDEPDNGFFEFQHGLPYGYLAGRETCSL